MDYIHSFIKANRLHYKITKELNIFEDNIFETINGL